MRLGLFVGVVSLGAAILAASGCGRDYVRKGGPSPYTYRQAELSYDEVQVENARGSVDVRIVPELARPKVRARQGYMGRGGDRGPLFAMTTQDVDGKRVLVITGLAGGAAEKPLSLAVDVRAVRGLRVVNAGGSVTVRGVVPERLEVMNGLQSGEGGDVRVASSTKVVGTMDLQSASGSISVMVPVGSAGMIDAKGGEGVEVKALREAVGPWTGNGTAMRGPLGDAQATWTLRAPQGRVGVQIVE